MNSKEFLEKMEHYYDEPAEAEKALIKALWEADNIRAFHRGGVDGVVLEIDAGDLWANYDTVAGEYFLSIDGDEIRIPTREGQPDILLDAINALVEEGRAEWVDEPLFPPDPDWGVAEYEEYVGA